MKMKMLVIILVVFFLIFSGTAFGFDGFGNNNNNDHSHHNNYGDTYNGDTYNEGGEGGEGGNAEANAGAIGVGVGIGVGSADVDIKNRNKNTNLNMNDNVNRNKNVIEEGAVKNNNTDINVNGQKQGQLQGQLQGQKQGQQQDQDQQQKQNQTAHNEGVEQDVTLNQTYEDSRDFSNVNGPHSGPNFSEYNGPFTAGPQVMSAEEILSYQNIFTYDSLNLSKSGIFEGVRVKFRPVLVSPMGEGVTADRVTFLKSTKAIEKGTKTLIGFMYVQATGDEADTALVLMKAGKAICEEGANVAILIGEGYTTDTQAFGWGIGFSYTQAWISSDQKSSGGGAGGTGISGMKTGPETKPWMQFAIYHWTSK